MRGDPIEPFREPPVAVAQNFHDRGHQHQADEGRVDQDGDREPEPHLLYDRHRIHHEREEDADHDGCGRGDDPRGYGQAVGHRLGGCAPMGPVFADAAEQEDLVIHRKSEKNGEEEDRQEDGDRLFFLDPEELMADYQKIVAQLQAAQQALKSELIACLGDSKVNGQ